MSQEVWVTSQTGKSKGTDPPQSPQKERGPVNILILAQTSDLQNREIISMLF